MMPSFISNVALADAWGDQKEQEECKSEWVNRARDWLRKRRREETEEAVVKPPKKQRKKAAAWLACADQVLAKSCGTGLDFYRVAPASILTEDPWLWAHLTITPDQGPDGLAALYYLRYGQSMNVDVIYDLNHGVWRDQDLATKEIGQTSWTHLMVVCYNLLHSPWGSEARFCALREATEEYMRTADERCPLYRLVVCVCVWWWGFGAHIVVRSTWMSDIGATLVKDSSR